MNTGREAPASGSGLITTVAWGLDGELEYALEGSIFVAGAAVQWLRDELGIVKSASESQHAAESVPDTGGVVLVPAFTGLGAPHWDERARGAIVGLTRGTTREHIIRATLESIAYQTREVIECVHADSGLILDTLRVDGGACENDFLMQFQADILGVPVQRPPMLEVTALGAAALAGLATGFWSDRAALESVTTNGARRFEPRMSEDQREKLFHDWKRAVERAKGWEA